MHPFQKDVETWVENCFGERIAKDAEERSYRFLEESLELVQAVGISKESAHKLVDYVFSRSKGDIAQELGGVMVTLAALSGAVKHDMLTAGETEVTRCWQNIFKIREKHFSKPSFDPDQLHLELPVCKRCRSHEHHVSDCPE
jgi:NTP pyrophosphatase (non-canonical NTP hydrolase)